jgi:hypothetical protein
MRARSPQVRRFLMGKALLAAVEIDSKDTLSSLEQRHRDMKRDRGLARAALFVPEHNHVRRLGISLDRLDQHGAPHFSKY